MYITIAQTNPKVGAVKENADKALELLEGLAASTYPPDLVIFPAYALSGTPLDGLRYSMAFAAELIDATHYFINSNQLQLLIGTMIPRPLPDSHSFVSEPEVLYCKDGGSATLGFVDTFNEWDPENYASSVTTVIDGRKLTVLLDEFPEPDEDFSESDLVIMLMAKEYNGNNDMFTSSTQLGFLRGFANQNNTWVVVANLCGAQDGTVHDGASVVIRPDGKVAANALPFEEDILSFNINFDEPSLSSAFNSTSGGGVGGAGEGGADDGAGDADGTSGAGEGADKGAGGADEGASGASADADGSSGAKPGSPEGQPVQRLITAEPIVKPLLPYEADWKAIVACIRDYVKKNGFSDVLLGLSGGIDSAVVATLAVDALGAARVHAILMPGPHSSEGSIKDATDLAKSLGIQTLTLPIDGPLAAFAELYGQLPDADKAPGAKLARQNLQARIRTVHLMQLSNSQGWLLLNTGNKSEAAMGYSTLYGDTAGALAPLGNVYKCDVYGLARWRNERDAVIPQPCIDKQPSAELYDGQLDSDSLPPYPLLDNILRLHIEEGMGVDQILEAVADIPESGQITAELVEDVLDRVRAAEYKRRQEPLAPTLGYIDINNDRCWPLTNGFVDKRRMYSPGISRQDFLEMIDNWERPEGWGYLAN